MLLDVVVTTPPSEYQYLLIAAGAVGLVVLCFVFLRRRKTVA